MLHKDTLFFYRDSHHNEVDVLFHRGYDLVPIEIKSAKTFNKSFLKSLSLFEKLVGDRCQNPALIYSGLDEHKIKNVQLLHFSNAAKALNQ